MRKKIAVTIGDPSGIGPEIILKSIKENKSLADKLLLIGNKEIFLQHAEKFDVSISDLEIYDIEGKISNLKEGVPTIESGTISFHSVKIACEFARNGNVRAIVTAPISKKAINMAGFYYSGHTEILQEFINDNKPVEMFFVAEDFRILLLTRHIALAEVPKVLTREKIIESVLILHNSLKTSFKVNNPKIAICGLNPHAGEDGLLGNEELQVIIPAIKDLQSNYEINVDGPFPADTIWLKAAKPYFEKTSQPYDAYIACYHDQGLIPMKLLAMDETVNVTINMPVIRTSPSHGTAFDIAGKNIASFRSMEAAIKLADQISTNV